ncbi:hypothetical protein L7F22_046080 [Adiantum nelumboides]|nr:hypothetical protein [Adiantum nelumboides]
MPKFKNFSTDLKEIQRDTRLHGMTCPITLFATVCATILLKNSDDDDNDEHASEGEGVECGDNDALEADGPVLDDSLEADYAVDMPTVFWFCALPDVMPGVLPNFASEAYGDPLEHPQSESYWAMSTQLVGLFSFHDTIHFEHYLNVEVATASLCIDILDKLCISQEVEGLIWLMESEHIMTFNLGNLGEITMLELANVVKEVIDPQARIQFRQNIEDDPHKWKPDITMAKNLLHWEPIVPLKKCLQSMVEDF